MRTRLPVALVVLLACSACTEEVQEAEPLHTSVPVGLAIAVVGFGSLGVLTAWAWRRASAAGSPLRYPRGTAALVLAPTLLLGIALVAVLSGVVAFGFREPRTDLYSWDGWVTITAWVGGAVLLCHLVAASVSVAITGSGPVSRVLGRLILLALVVTTAMLGVGLVWVPGLIASVIVHRVPDESPLTQDGTPAARGCHPVA